MIRLSHWVLGTLLVLSAPLTFAESLLNGLAVHKEFNKDQFIGALYTENLSSDAATQLNTPGNKRLELRVIADRFSTRQLNSMWIEGMAINNPPNLLTSQAQHMVTFTGFVQRSLRAGDILAIRGSANRTTVSLNGVELGHIDSSEFFNMVLRTWIGNVPLSSEFRDQLLTNGDVNGALLAQFESIKPSAARTQTIAGWSRQEPQEAAAEDAAAVAEAPAADKADNKVATPPMAVEIAKPTLVAAPAAVPTPAPAEPAAAAAKPVAEPALVAPAPTTPAPQVAKAPAASAPAAAEEDEFDDEEDSAPLLTAESLLSRQMYHSQLLRWTYQNINYPKRAISRGHEGSVRLAVVIDRQGNVKNVVEVESSQYDSLNREALNAVERAKPFPAIPDTIKGEEFAFSLPIQFRLPD